MAENDMFHMSASPFSAPIASLKGKMTKGVTVIHTLPELLLCAAPVSQV